MLEDESLVSLTAGQSKKRKSPIHKAKNINKKTGPPNKKLGRPRGSRNKMKDGITKVPSPTNTQLKTAPIYNTVDDPSKSTVPVASQKSASMPNSTSRIGLSLPQYNKGPRYVFIINCYQCLAHIF